MFGSLRRALHSLIGLILAILLLPIASFHVFFPLGLALAVIIWPSAFVTFCLLSVTCVFWVPALLFCFVVFSIVAFFFEVIASFYGAFRDAIRQPPQHPQPFRDVPALPSGIPASRSDSLVGGSSLPQTPGADGAADVPGWLEQRFAILTQRNETDYGDEIDLVIPASSRGIRNYPPRRSSSIVATSSSSVNVAASSSSVNISAPAHSTTSINSILTNSSARSAAAPTTPNSPATPTRQRTKSISFEDGSRPGLSASHSTTSMVTGSPRVSSQQGVNSSTTSLGSTTGSIEGAAESLRVAQLMQEASEDENTHH